MLSESNNNNRLAVKTSIQTCTNSSCNNSSLGLSRVSSSSFCSSTSASTSTFSSSSPSPLQSPALTSKTMEEVWKDINLASLNDHPSAVDHDFSLTPSRLLHHPPSPNFILQDFLGRPFKKDPPTRIINSSSSAAAAATTTATSTAVLYGGSTHPPPPATVLSLNSRHGGFDFLDNADPLAASHLVQTQSNNLRNISSLGGHPPFVGLDPPTDGLRSFGKKRVPESDSSSGDRRHKRMIKNRESAARSRARKQAYTNELELEVKHLAEENARLKRQQEEICLAAAAQLSKRHTLYRTSTAPF